MHRKCLLYSQFVYEINLAMCRQYDWLSAKMLQVDLCYSSRFTLAHQQSDAVWTTPPLKIACPAHHSTMHQTLLRIWASSWGILGWPCIVYILLYNMMSFAMRVQQLLRIVCHKFERVRRLGGRGRGGERKINTSNCVPLLRLVATTCYTIDRQRAIPFPSIAFSVILWSVIW